MVALPNRHFRRSICLLLICPLYALGQNFHNYIGQISATSVLIAWGRADGKGNTIGRTSTPYGKASVRIGGQDIPSDQNWIIIKELQPDTEYPYEIFVNGRKIGEGKVRTYPQRSNRLAFFVIGDYGTGNSKQFQVADAMWREFERRSGSDNPVRFILSAGDNIYADLNLLISKNSGDEDWHWEKKFFRPYEPLIRQIPFYPTLGNHDGNGSESRGDLAVYLDNFFFPDETPSRYYRFSYGGLADFFALDSTDNSATGPPAPAYSLDGVQFSAVKEWLATSRAPWKIPYFHHPPFNAGPRHGSNLPVLRHFVELFQKSGVKVVFNGHEHNFQFSEQNSATGGICYVISGAGGELRPEDVTRKMEAANIAGWAGQRHFLVVELVDRAMRITPLSYEPIVVKDKNGRPINMPVVVNLP